MFIPVSKLPEYDHNSMTETINYNSHTFLSQNIGSREGESHDNMM